MNDVEDKELAETASNSLQQLLYPKLDAVKADLEKELKTHVSSEIQSLQLNIDNRFSKIEDQISELCKAFFSPPSKLLLTARSVPVRASSHPSVSKPTITFNSKPAESEVDETNLVHTSQVNDFACRYCHRKGTFFDVSSIGPFHDPACQRHSDSIDNAGDCPGCMSSMDAANEAHLSAFEGKVAADLVGGGEAADGEQSPLNDSAPEEPAITATEAASAAAEAAVAAATASETRPVVVPWLSPQPSNDRATAASSAAPAAADADTMAEAAAQSAADVRPPSEAGSHPSSPLQSFAADRRRLCPAYLDGARGMTTATTASDGGSVNYGQHAGSSVNGPDKVEEERQRLAIMAGVVASMQYRGLGVDDVEDEARDGWEDLSIVRSSPPQPSFHRSCDGWKRSGGSLRPLGCDGNRWTMGNGPASQSSTVSRRASMHHDVAMLRAARARSRRDAAGGGTRSAPSPWRWC